MLKKAYAPGLGGKSVRGCKRDAEIALELSETESHWECESICAQQVTSQPERRLYGNPIVNDVTISLISSWVI